MPNIVLTSKCTSVSYCSIMVSYKASEGLTITVIQLAVDMHVLGVVVVDIIAAARLKTMQVTN